MRDQATVDREELVSYDEAVRETGLSWHTLRRRLAANGVPVYSDPVDGRRRVFPRQALEVVVSLKEARALTPRKDGKAA